MLVLILLLTYLREGASQITGSVGNATTTMFTTANLNLPADPSSPHHPDDFYVQVEFLTSSFYTLGSNNIFQFYNSINPSTTVQTFTNYSHGINPGFEFISFSISNIETMMIVSSFWGGTLKHLSFGIGSNGINILNNITGDHSFST